MDARDDEVTLRAAMVRDIMRTAWELNSFFAKNDIEFHIICSLRPEVRNLINDMDSEAGKYLDGKDVELTWVGDTFEDRSLLLELLHRKIKYSEIDRPNLETFFFQTVDFGRGPVGLDRFISDNTWGRPRDIIRLLSSLAKKSPDAIDMDELVLKKGLDEYSRMSLKELVDELGVAYGQQVIKALRQKIQKRTYDSAEQLWDAVGLSLTGVDPSRFVEALFQLGFIGGYDPQKGRFYWAHRGENYLKPTLKVLIHPGLWNELSIRSS